MADFQHSSALTQTPAVVAIRAKLGLTGYARLLLVLEECTDNGQAAMRRSDWLATLSCSGDDFDEFLALLAKTFAFHASQGEEVAAPLMLSIGPALAFLLAPPDPATVIYTEARQWSAWVMSELAAPAWLVNDPASQELFRRWCATNVSQAEMIRAAEQAGLARDLSPVGLHEQLKLTRAARLAQARTRA
jgi:hypothetical protein